MKALLCAGLSLLTAGAALAQLPTAAFTPLPDFSATPVDSKANAVSGDGSVAVGYGTNNGVQTPCYWKNGMINAIAAGAGQAFGVSLQGRVIVGTGTYAGKPEPFRWSASTGSHYFPLPPGYDRGAARGISDDGNVIVGFVFNAPGNSVRAVRWDSSGVHLLHPAGALESRAWCISGNGSIMAGSYKDMQGITRPCIFTGGGAIVDLPMFDFATGGEVLGISDSAKLFVGYQNRVPDQNGTTQIDAEWYIPAGQSNYIAYSSFVDNATGNNNRAALAANGTAVVGFGYGHNGSASDAFLMNPNYSINDMHTLAPVGSRSFEQDFNGLPPGWQTLSATGLSSDGQTIVGLAQNPAGRRQAYMFTTQWLIGWEYNAGGPQIDFQWGNDGSQDPGYVSVISSRTDLVSVVSPIPITTRTVYTYGDASVGRTWPVTLTGNFTAGPVTVSLTGHYADTTIPAYVDVPASTWSINLNSASVVGGGTIIGNVSTSAKRPKALTVTMSTDQPSYATVFPSTLTISAGTGTGSAPFNIRTNGTPADQSVTLSATIDGVTLNRVFTIKAATVSGLRISPSPAPGGTTANLYIFLNGKAPSGGLTFTLSSSNAAFATVPANASIPEGKTYTVVPVSTKAVTSNSLVTIGVTPPSGPTMTVDLTVTPAKLASLVFSPSSITGGSPVTLYIKLNGIAGTGGDTVTLNSDHPELLHLPTTATVPAGKSYVAISVPTSSTATATTVTAHGTDANGGDTTGQVTINP